jgi:hypothetical protein
MRKIINRIALALGFVPVAEVRADIAAIAKDAEDAYRSFDAEQFRRIDSENRLASLERVNRRMGLIVEWMPEHQGYALTQISQLQGPGDVVNTAVPVDLPLLKKADLKAA